MDWNESRKNERGKGVHRDFCMGIPYSKRTMKGELNISRAKIVNPWEVEMMKARRWAALPLLSSMSECQLSSLGPVSYPTSLRFSLTDSFLMLLISFFSFSLSLFKSATMYSKFIMDTFLCGLFLLLKGIFLLFESMWSSLYVAQFEFYIMELLCSALWDRSMISYCVSWIVPQA